MNLQKILNYPIIVTSALAAATGLADQFTNPSLSPIMVSPAQQYQYEGTRFESQVLRSSSETTVLNRTTDSRSTSTTTGNGLQAAGTWGGGSLPLTGSLHLGRLSAEQKNKSTGATTESTMTSINPSVSVDLYPQVSAGLSVGFNQQDTPDLPDSSGSSWVEKRVGIAWHNDRAEAGLAWQPETGDDGDAFHTESRAMIHGRYRLSPVIAVGGILTKADYSQTSDRSKDVVETTVTTEFRPVEKVAIEGLYEYRPAHNKEKADLSAENMARQNLLVSTDYQVRPEWTMGGFLGSEFASETSDQNDIDDSSMTVGLRGSYSF